LVSPNTVQRILKDAGLLSQEEKSPPKGPSGKAHTSEKPGQTINVDLAFVPTSHEAVTKLPAVSGSSGRLVVERVADNPGPAPQWPGCVFDNDSLSYEKAMEAFMAASEAKSKASESASADSSADVTIKAQKRAICQEEEALRAQRRQVRQQRKKEEAEWAALRVQRRAQQRAVQLQKQKALPIQPELDFSQEAANSEPAISANSSDATLPSLAQEGATGVFLKPAHDTEATWSKAAASGQPDACTNAAAEKEQTLLTESSAPCITDEKWRQHREERRAQRAQRKVEDEQSGGANARVSGSD